MPKLLRANPFQKQRQLNIVADYVAGHLVGFIAQKYGVHPSYVRKLASKQGIAPRKRGCKPSAKRAVVQQDYREGLKVKEIAARHGIAVGSVSKMARRAGIPPRLPQSESAKYKRWLREQVEREEHSGSAYLQSEQGPRRLSTKEKVP